MVILRTILLLQPLLRAACVKLRPPVVESTDKNFGDNVRAGHAFVVFCEPWHKDCNALHPKFERAAGAMRHHLPPVLFSRIDCQRAGRHTCKKHAIHSYPMFKLFRDGAQAAEYLGPPETDDIVRFVAGAVGAGAKHVGDREAHYAFLAERRPGLVGYFAAETGLKRHFLEVCDAREHRCAVVTDRRLFHANSTGNDVILFRPRHLRNVYEDDFVIYNPVGPPGIPNFVKERLHGLVGHRTLENYREFRPPFVVVYSRIDYVRDPKGTNYVRNRVFPVAAEFRGSFRFAVSDTSEHKNEIFKTFHLDVQPLHIKTLVLAKDNHSRKYRMDREFSTANLRHFVTSILDGSIEPHIKSQPPPTHNNGTIKIVVAKNFAETILDNVQDVLVLLYEQWHFKTERLLRTYEALGELMRGEDVAVAKMEAVENEVPELFHVNEIPTAYWVPRDAKDKPVRFAGSHRIEELVRFVSRMAGGELKAFYRNGTAKQRERTGELPDAA